MLEESIMDSLPGPIGDILNGNPRVVSLEHIDARKNELNSNIPEAMSASAQNRQPANQSKLSILVMTLAKIREMNRLKRQGKIVRDPSTNNQISRL